ncbi:hypothetical protein BH23ACT4_BH23ACT4_14370 [soil metagenome]
MDVARQSSLAGGGSIRRHARKALVALVAVIGLFGISDLLLGLDADPAISVGVSGLTPDEIRETSEPVARLADLQVRAGALQLIALSCLWGVILLIPYRRGERWAWHTMWSFPAWSLSVSLSFLFVDLHPDVPPPPPAISGWVFFGLSSLLLATSRRDFGM